MAARSTMAAYASSRAVTLSTLCVLNPHLSKCRGFRTTAACLAAESGGERGFGGSADGIGERRSGYYARLEERVQRDEGGRGIGAFCLSGELEKAAMVILSPLCARAKKWRELIIVLLLVYS